jgi:transcriptional regulator with XRE-family HTH domain
MIQIAGERSELTAALRRSFRDEEYRYGYVESFLDAFIAAQLRALRSQRGWEQEDLAKRMGTKQSAISRLENVNYSSWSISTLKRLARVFGVRLKVSFEEFATLPTDIENFNTCALERRSFEHDRILGPIAFWSVDQNGEPKENKAQGSHEDLLNPVDADDPQRRKPPQSTKTEGEGAQSAAIGNTTR